MNTIGYFTILIFSINCVICSLDEEYDFIIVGAGPGGATVANRLSENPNWNVLLVEAGGPESFFLQIPGLTDLGQLSPEYNWGYKAEPDPRYGLGLKGQQCLFPKGKGLGGSSAINHMIYTRGNREDYDDWSAKGNTGWGYDDVLQYFIKSEAVGMVELINRSEHGLDGYLPVEGIPYRTKVMDGFLAAGEELGLLKVDYNDGDTAEGFFKIQVMMKHGHRRSANTAFLNPVKDRKNLHISTYSHVTKILIDPLTKTAYGVEVFKQNKTITIKAHMEVILSAGPFGTPQLLMLSGVGPKDNLEELKIPVIEDLPVGRNLQDHALFPGLIFLVNETYTSGVESRINTFGNFKKALLEGTGPLTVPYAEGIGFIHTKYSDPSKNRPDVELLFKSFTLVSDSEGNLRKVFGLTDEVYKKYIRPHDERDSWTVWPFPLHPKSRGFMKLVSRDPFTSPKFYPNYYEDETDLETTVEAIKFVIALSQTKAFQKYGSELSQLKVPGCENFEFGSDDYWKCAIRHFTASFHHQVGTCKMGPAEDKTAVVSPELKVHGIENLRVVDSSVMPELISGHTTAPTFMIGEKGSAMIKLQWGYQDENVD